MPGILPYANFNPMTGTREADDVWVMISQERGGGNKGEWDFFNGRLDPGETSKQAAAREGHEESCGLFGKIDELSKKMIGLHNSGSGFLINAEDFKSKQEIMEKCTPEEYLKRKKFAKYKAGCYQEKTEVKWVKLSSLIDACAKDRILRNDKGAAKQGADGKDIKIRAPLVSLVNKNVGQLKGLLKIQKVYAEKANPAKINQPKAPQKIDQAKIDQAKLEDLMMRVKELEDEWILINKQILVLQAQKKAA